MSNKAKMIGLTLAAAAAVTFATAPMTSSLANAKDANVKCFGGNACKGQSACKTNANACKGQNTCKGQGVSLEKSKKACKAAGGSTKDTSTSSTS